MDISFGDKIRALQTTVSTVFESAFGSYETWSPRVSTVVPSSSRSNTYAWAATNSRMREWLGPRVIENLGAHEYEIKNRSFEKTVAVSRDDVEDDNVMGQAVMDFQGMGIAAAKLPDDLVLEAINAGKTAHGFDGVPFFSGSHPLDPSGNQSNLLTGSALSAANFAAAKAHMAGFTGEDGRPLGCRGSLLMVPPQLEYAARQIINASIVSDGSGGGVSNVLQGSAEILVVDELADDPTSWYLADTRKQIKPFIYQTRKAVQMTRKEGETEDNVFFDNKILWGISGRSSAGFGPWFLCLRSEA